MAQLMKRAAMRTLLEYPVVPLCVGLVLAVLPLRPEFASAINFEILLLSWSLLSVMAIAQAMVLITGGIDLSLPAVMALASVAALPQWPRAVRWRGRPWRCRRRCC